MTIHGPSLSPPCKFILVVERKVLERDGGLLGFCSQPQMEEQFTLTEGVIINQTTEHTAAPGHFIQPRLLWGSSV